MGNCRCHSLSIRQVSDPDVGLTAQEEKRKQASNDDYAKNNKSPKVTRMVKYKPKNPHVYRYRNQGDTHR